MQTPDIVAYLAEGAIGAYTLVKPGASGGAVLGAAATDKLLGVAANVDTATGQTADVIVRGVTLVKAAGTIAAGDPVTSNASGLAVVAAPAAGVNNRIVGIALEAAVSGDLFRVNVSLGVMQG